MASIIVSSDLESGQRIWRGNLHVKGHRNDMIVPCVAVRYLTPSRPSVQDANGWPSHIHCDSSKVKQCSSVYQYINEASSQWFVRFAPVNEQGSETQDQKLVQLAKVMVQRQLAYEINCGEDTTGPQGTLYLWGMPMPPHGHSLLGVFRPNSNKTEMPASQIDKFDPSLPDLNMALNMGMANVSTNLGAETEQRIWRGNLHVRGHRSDMDVPCVAVRYLSPGRPSVQDANGWPSHIHCDSSKVKQCSSVYQYINEASSQWYVRFAPVNEQGSETQDQTLVQLVEVMARRQLAYEINCGEDTTGPQGTLYLWGMPMPPHGHSLLGVFRPSSNDADFSLKQAKP